jgi:hypothetical protein
VCPSLLYLHTLAQQLEEYTDEPERIVRWYSQSLKKDRDALSEIFTNTSTHNYIVLTTSSYLPVIPKHFYDIVIIEPNNLFHSDQNIKISHAQKLIQTSSVPLTLFTITEDTRTYIQTVPAVCIPSRIADEHKNYLSIQPATLLPSHIHARIVKAHKEKKTIGIFSLQTGFSGRIFCTSCKKSAQCMSCSKPIKKHITKDGEPIFWCSHEKKNIPLFDMCQFCGGLTLIEIGLGTEQIEQALAHDIPHAPLLRIDSFMSEQSITPKKIAGLMSATRDEHGIIIGSLKAFMSAYVPLDELIIFGFDHLSFNLIGDTSGPLILAHIITRAASITLVCDDPKTSVSLEDIIAEVLIEP